MFKLRKQIRNTIAATTLLSWLCTFASTEACTGIKLTTKDGSVVHGRTLEFGIQINATVVVIPRNYQFESTTPQGPGLSYKAKYGAVGATTFDTPAIMDGLNEKGLAVAVFYFPGFAGYTNITAENQAKALSPIDFPNWILTQFQSIDEVKKALSSVVIAPTVYKAWGTGAPPFHYIVYDKTGHALVIEPVDGKLVTYDNPLGVFTNSPSFDWHMTNLRNFINLTPVNAKAITLNGVELAPFGQGSGMVGIEGDFTPPSRFVRAAIFSTTAIPSENADKGVFQVFHILNQFDIPVGAARDVVNGVIHSDYTQITSVKDPQSLKYYFRTYDDQSVKVVDLNKFDLNAKEMKRVAIAGHERAEDISSSLK